MNIFKQKINLFRFKFIYFYQKNQKLQIIKKYKKIPFNKFIISLIFMHLLNV